jgi:hypothetical protein
MSVNHILTIDKKLKHNLLISYIGYKIGFNISNFFDNISDDRDENIVLEYLFSYIDKGFYYNLTKTPSNTHIFRLALLGLDTTLNSLFISQDNKSTINQDIKIGVNKIFKNYKFKNTRPDKYLKNVIEIFEPKNSKNVIPYNNKKFFFYPLILSSLISLYFINNFKKIAKKNAIKNDESLSFLIFTHSFHISSLISISISSPLVASLFNLFILKLFVLEDLKKTLKNILETLKSEQFINSIITDEKFLEKNYEVFEISEKIETYYNNKFITDNNDNLSHNLVYRYKSHVSNYIGINHPYKIGETSISAFLFAIDSLIDCDGNWEKLIYYSSLHDGYPEVTTFLSSILFSVAYRNKSKNDYVLKNYLRSNYNEFLKI